MVAVPMPCAVTRPDAVTDTMPGALEVQKIGSPISASPRLLTTVAASWRVRPSEGRASLDGLTVTVAGWLVTTMVNWSANWVLIGFARPDGRDAASARRDGAVLADRRHGMVVAQPLRR